MIVVWILFFSSFNIEATTVPKIAIHAIESAATDNGDHPMLSNDDVEFEKLINTILVQVNESNQELQGFLRNKAQKTNLMIALKKDADYAELRQNASVIILERLLLEHKYNPQVRSLLLRKKDSLKLDVKSYEHYIGLLERMDFSKILTEPLNIMAMKIPIYASVEVLWKISHSNQSKIIRDRANKEFAYIKSLNLTEEQYLTESTKDRYNYTKVVNVLTIPELDMIKLNLTKSESHLIQSIQDFKQLYRKNLEKQILHLWFAPFPEERDQSEGKMISSIDYSQKDKLIYNINVLQELLDKHLYNLTEYVFINEKLSKLKQIECKAKKSILNTSDCQDEDPTASFSFSTESNDSAQGPKYIQYYLMSRWKVDPFIFQRRLERIEERIKYLVLLVKDVNQKRTLETALAKMEIIDYTEMSSQTMQKFAKKFANVAVFDKKNILEALNLKPTKKTTKDDQKKLYQQLSNREKKILYRMKKLQKVIQRQKGQPETATTIARA